MDKRKKSIKDFKRTKLVVQTKDITKKVRITFYRTKKGFFSPSPYCLKYRKLSEVLK